MYVLAPGQVVKTYPYSISALMRDNPNTSFSANPTEAALAEWSVFPVIDVPAPSYNPANENCNQVDPIYIDGKWTMAWAVTPATPEQIAERTTAKAADVRGERNQRLANCDWTQLPDAPVDRAEWAVYRQQLRDVTSQPGFPWTITWPTEPTK